jgi:hypothetical protein
MFWSVVGAVIGLLVFAGAVEFATLVRDDLQIILSHRRKLKASGSHEGNRLLLILLLPITVYLILGTLLMLLLCVIEMATKRLRHYAGEADAEIIAWHQVSLFLTLLFPASWPILALLVGLVFAGAVFMAAFTFARNVFIAVLNLVRRIWVNVVHALQAFLEWCVDRLRLVWEMIVAGTQAIWEMIVAGTQTVWELVVGTIQQVFEQITALVHEVWATINAKIRV